MDAMSSTRDTSRLHADAALAARALDAVAPMIEQAMRDPAHGDGGFLHIVVMDPALGPASSTFEEAILHERSFGGERARWDADYAAFAREKARVSWRSRRDNPRGAVCVDGFVVGASGAFEPFDQAYSGAVAMWLRALARAGQGGGRPA
jgi:hypothetical protein